MDNEIEKIAKKYRLGGEQTERSSHKSVDAGLVQSHQPRTAPDKSRMMAMENYKLKQKYSEALDKINSLNKELAKVRTPEPFSQNANDSFRLVSEEMEKTSQELLEYKESVDFFQIQCEALIKENERASLIYNQQLEYYKEKLEYYQGIPNIDSFYTMKEIIDKQNKDICVLKESLKMSENMIHTLKKELAISHCDHEVENTEINIMISSLREKHEEEKKNNRKYIDENNFLKAKLKNMEYELEISKSKYPVRSVHSKLLE